MASAGSAPKPPDPQQTIALQNQYNRYNTNGPFGGTSWTSGGPGGHETMNTSLSPQMQGAMDSAFSAAAAPRQQMQIPQGMDQLASAILGRVGARYGIGSGFSANNPTISGLPSGPMSNGSSPLNTNLKQGMQAPPQPQPQPIPGMPGMPGASGMPPGGMQTMPHMSLQGGIGGNPTSMMGG